MGLIQPGQTSVGEGLKACLLEWIGQKKFARSSDSRGRVTLSGSRRLPHASLNAVSGLIVLGLGLGVWGCYGLWGRAGRNPPLGWDM